MNDYVTSFFLTLISIAVLLVVYIKWSQTYWKRKGIPYLTPAFPFGNFENPITTRTNFSDCFKRVYQQSKRMGIRSGGIYIFTVPNFLIADPVHIKHVLLKNFQAFQIRGFYTNEKSQPVSVNIVTAEGEKWRNLRTKLTPTFTTAKMKFMFNLMVEVAKSMEAFFEEYAVKRLPLNAMDCANYFATDIIGSCAFGVDCNSYKDQSFNTLLAELLEETTGLAKMSLSISFPKLARFLGIPLFEPKRIAYLCNLIDDAVRHRNNDASMRRDLLQILLELKNDGIVDDNEIRAQCILFFMAGHETVSTAMMFTFLELALNQDIQDKLRKEIHETLTKYNGVISYEAVMDMKYAEMVICEVLRKYPPIPILNRRSIKDVVLPGTDFVIERNTNITIPVVGLHTDPDYFPDPDKFDPERFSEENKINIVPYTYLPFGNGPRGCMGERFSKQEMKVGLLRVIGNYRIRLNPMVKLPIKFVPSLVVKPETDILLDVEAICK